MSSPTSCAPSLSSSVAKRKEPKTACLLCRRRKVACDRRRPKCGLCSRNDFDCTYTARERRPGLRAGYVSQLEERIATLEGRVSDLERRPDTTLDGRGSDSAPGLVIETFEPEVRHTSTTSNLAGTPMPRNQSPSQDMQPANNKSISPPDPQPTWDSLAPEVISELCKLWLQLYDPWFPILHASSLGVLYSTPELRTCGRYLMARAVVAATIHHCQALGLATHQRQHLANECKNIVVTEAFQTPSMDAIQALLILSINEYGSGRLREFWNMMALCKRLEAQLRLRNSVVVTQPGNGQGATVTVLKHLAEHFQPETMIERQEWIRAYWMTEVLDNISTIGTNHDIQSSHIAPNSALPCSDSLWALPGSAIDEWSIGQYRYSSSFALCIILSVTELHKIHQFLQTPCDMNDLEKMYEWQTGAQRIDESLTMWREDFVAAVFRLINAESSHEMEPYVVLTNCVLNTAVITLFQARSPCPAGIDKTTEPWSYATTRCVYACENMAHKIRRMSEDETRNCNPHLLYSIFVAARFYIVYSKALDADVPINLHSLAFALRTASVRWPLARCCETVIRTAVAEHRTPVETSSLPKEFYDLRYSSVEILDILLTWTQNCPPGMGICDIGTENTE